jgi:hypothetical protein
VVAEQSNETAAACLVRLVALHGTAIRSAPEQLEALLRECCPQCSVQTFALTSLAREGIVDELVSPHDGAGAKHLKALATRTVAELGLSPQVARWAVDAWAGALGLTSFDDVVGSDLLSAASDEDDAASGESAPGHRVGVLARVAAGACALAAVVLVVGIVVLRGAGPLTTSTHIGSVPRPAKSTSTVQSVATTGTDKDAIAKVLSTYYRAIDNKDYQAAWEQFSPQQQQRIGGIRVFTAGVATSYVTSAALLGVTQQSPGVDLATVTFVSNQSPASSPDRQECDSWSLVYTMIQADGAWRIDKAMGANGVPYQPC